MSVHIEAKKEDIADLVLMPGDPLRAKYIAENYLKDYKLVNTIRNMYAYTGYYKNKRITVMGSGMGIPSIGIYSYELYKFYDVKKIIRIGTMGSLNKDLKLMDIILAKKSYSPSSFAYVFSKDVNNVKYSSESLNNKILETAKSINLNITYGDILTADVFTVYADINHILKKVPNNINLLGNEMEAFGLFHIANILNREAACLATIVDSPYIDKQVSDSDKEKNLNDMIILALESI